MRHIRVKKGDVIFTEGSLSDTFYIIVEGYFQVSKLDSKGRKNILSNLGPNEFFGEMGILTGEARTATVISMCLGELKVLSPDEFDLLIDTKPEILRPILKVLTKRLNECMAEKS